MNDEVKHTIEDIEKLVGKDITNRLLGVITEGGIVNWFYRPNDEFEGKTPYELCQSGDEESLERMCYQLESGQAD